MKVLTVLTAAAAGTSLRGQKLSLEDALANVGTTFTETTQSVSTSEQASQKSSESIRKVEEQKKAQQVVQTFNDLGQLESTELKEFSTFFEDVEQEKATEKALAQQLLKQKSVTEGAILVGTNGTRFVVTNETGTAQLKEQAKSLATSEASNFTNLTELKALIKKEITEEENADGEIIEVETEVAQISREEDAQLDEEQAVDKAETKSETLIQFNDFDVAEVGSAEDDSATTALLGGEMDVFDDNDFFNSGIDDLF